MPDQGDGRSRQPHPPAPDGLDCGGRLRRAYPGMAACRIRPAGCPGAGARLRTGIQIEDTGGTRIVLARVPPLAHGVVTGYQLRRHDDRPPYGMHLRTRGASAMAIRKTLSAADAGVGARRGAA